MKVLEAKDARKLKSFGVKVPVALHQKIADLDKQVRGAGYVIDWSGPAAKALEVLAAQVERDLAEVEKRT